MAEQPEQPEQPWEPDQPQHPEQSQQPKDLFPVSWIDVINRVDALPEYDFGNAFKLFLPEDNRPHGLMRPHIAEMLANASSVKVNFETKEVHLHVHTDDQGHYKSTAINVTLKHLVEVAHKQGAFLPDSDRTAHEGEMVCIPGALEYPEVYEKAGATISRSRAIVLDRVAAEDVFGVCRCEVHTICYVPEALEAGESSIWVQSEFNWGHIDALIWLDYNWTEPDVVLPGQPTIEMLKRYGNNSKTLSITASGMMPCHKAVAYSEMPPPIVYMTEHDGRVTPVAAYVVDREVNRQTRPQYALPPNGRWEGPRVAPGAKFLRLDVHAIMFALKHGHFKASAVMVMVDFLVRHGCITAASDPVDYPLIVERLRRRHPVAVHPRDEML